MVVVKLEGGLGNQLFQYAFGRAVSIHRRTRLKLDGSWYRASRQDPKVLRTYLLSRYDIAGELAGVIDLVRVLGPVSAVRNEIRNRAPFSIARHIGVPGIRQESQAYRFDASVLSDPRSCFEGFWQSPKYFDAVGADIRNELRLRGPTAPTALTERIAATESVAVHFRRTDYETGGWGISEDAYYDRAIATIRRRVVNPTFVVFSDDVGWARQWVSDHPGAVLASDGARSTPDELHLMAQCRHFVIANSTFSWWAAWLSSHERKIVIAPREWSRTHPDTDDVFPRDWLRM